jgi:predicted nucleic acid-binding protein
MTTAFDADVLVYAAAPEHPLGARVAPLFDAPTARLSLALAVKYGLRAADATHLATAVAVGADRFLTNNRKDFPRSITEVDVVYPDDLPVL